MSVQMIVKKAFRPGGSGSPLLEPGSSFVAGSESQARLCRAMGWCVDAPPVPDVGTSMPKSGWAEVVAVTVAKRTYTRKVVDAEESVPAKRTYKRRDLTAD
jgi:hypothetical protein